MLHDLLRGKLFGHPIHVMLVHFPAALLPLAAALDALSLFAGLGPYLDSKVLLWPGIAFGYLAALFGVWDLARLKSASKEMSVALVHGGVNACAVGGFTWALFVPDARLRCYIEIGCTILMLVGNKFGGDLIFQFGIGAVGK
jgi:uncharacterized membrane protein